MFLDDRPLAGACADKLTYEWRTQGLADGKHTLDVVATNSKLQTSKRRFEVYAGNVFLTDLGTRFDDAKQTTEIGVRNIALAKETAGKVELSVYAADGEGKRGAQVFQTAQAGSLGAMTFAWNGQGTDGKPRARGKYIAELTFRDAGGKVVQRTETVFVQDSESVQHANFAEIEGNLSLDGAGDSANTTVELVNAKGEVMQRVQSTAKGNYRFKSVDKGNYKVRVSKKGFWAKEADVEAKPAAKPSKADFMLK
jgi:flagellar hook assembly protein FlgD